MLYIVHEKKNQIKVTSNFKIKILLKTETDRYSLVIQINSAYNHECKFSNYDRNCIIIFDFLFQIVKMLGRTI